MNQNSIITAASNKFFPSLVNFLGSLHINYPGHPDVYIYNLGLSKIFLFELKKIKWVHILSVPNFVPHWRACYTWKTFILNNPITPNNFYVDSGCEFRKPLDEIFNKIDQNGYFLVDQGNEVLLKDISPDDYLQKYNIDSEKYNLPIIAAGIFGFKKDNRVIKSVTDELYLQGKNGLCLGYSKNELWKNKGVNKNEYVRDCKYFRHDTTLLSLIVYSKMKSPEINSVQLFGGEDNKNQYIWNLRMNYKRLKYLSPRILHDKNFSIIVFLNRIYIGIFILFKIFWNNFKSITKIK